MNESYELVVVNIPGTEAQVYVRTWESGEVDVDYRPDPSATWLPIIMAGGSFRLEPSNQEN